MLRSSSWELHTTTTMKCSAGILLLSVVLTGVSCLQATPVKPVFKDSYHATGHIRLPYAELNEPFEIYYQAKNHRSRMDVYKGMDMTFNRGDEKPYGNTYKISPATLNDKQPSVTACFQVEGTKEAPVMAQSMLPDLTGFTFLRSDVINGQAVDMWQNKTTSTYFNISRVSTYTLAVTQTKPPRPVRYEMQGFDSLIGSHYDRYYIDYEFYDETTPIADKTFDVPSGLKCQGFPGPGIEHEIVATPFREMVNPELGDRYHQLFDEYKKTFSKNYDSKEEHVTRKGHFTKNVRMIHSINRAKLSYGVAINHLADRSFEEMRMLRGRTKSKGPNNGRPFDSSNMDPQVPDEWNWNVLGPVSQVKDQAICGSCWSFGSAEAIEGAYFMKYKKRVRLSQQMLMDCSWAKGNNGCDGGEEWRVYEWLMEHGGLETEETYGPYLGQNGMCHFNKSLGVAEVKSYTNITSGNQTELKMALYNKGPIAVGIFAALPSFGFYSYGVYYDAKCGNSTDDLDHAVLAVGYGTSNNQSYWLIKNSWSTYWGNNGYVMISMKDNNCGVATDATYPTLK